MRVVLVRPPSILGELTETSALHHPINLAYLGAALKRGGCSAALVDCEVQAFNAGLILEQSPDLVGFTAVTANAHLAARLAAAVKQARPRVPILLGGVHASVAPEASLERFPALDACVIGEGEETLVEVAACLARGHGVEELEGVRGLCLRTDRGPVRTGERPLVPNLDELPFPDRSLIRMPLYRRASSPGFSRRFLRITEIFTSRGCAHRCIFCAAPALGRGRVRFRSVENTAAEMRACISAFGTQHFTVNDDNFAADRGRVIEFCDRVRPMGVTWSCETRVTAVDRELVQAMAAAGCVKINFGPESGSPRMLELIKKGATVEAVERAFALAREAGIQRMGFFQVGCHPDETPEDLEQTRRLIARIEPDFVTVSIATPYPGTELEKMMRAKGLISSDDWADYRLFGGRPAWRTAHFSADELVRLQNSMTRRFYLRPRYLARRLAMIRHPAELAYWFRAGFGLLKFFAKKRPGERAACG